MLHLAAAGGHKETVKVLWELGANVHAQAKCGNIPLYFAEHFGHVAVVRFLRKKAVNM